MNRVAMMLLASMVTVAQTNSPSNASGKPATVVFYRYNTVTATSASIKIDGPKVTYKLSSNHFWTAELTVGQHTIAGDEMELAKAYPLEAGETYYFRVELKNPGGAFTLKKPRFRV